MGTHSPRHRLSLGRRTKRKGNNKGFHKTAENSLGKNWKSNMALTNLGDKVWTGTWKEKIHQEQNKLEKEVKISTLQKKALSTQTT